MSYLTNEDIDAITVYFNQIKGYAKHEDGLLNNRVNWCLLFNSFLFTAVAVLTAQSAGLAAKFPIPILGEQRSVYSVAVLSIAFTGMILTLSSALGVVAATLALGKLEQIWVDTRSRFKHSDIYPSLLGAGSSSANHLGMWYPVLLVAALLGVWVVMFSVCWNVTLPVVP